MIEKPFQKMTSDVIHPAVRQSNQSLLHASLDTRKCLCTYRGEQIEANGTVDIPRQVHKQDDESKINLLILLRSQCPNNCGVA
jgi:hypothetical protein